MIKRKQKRSDLPERRAERQELFRDIVYGAGAGAETPLRQTRTLTRNLLAMRYSAAVIIVSAPYWLIYDYLTGGKLRYSTGIALAATLCLIAFAVYMLCLSLRRGRNAPKLIRCSFLGFYLCLITFVIILSVTVNQVLLDSRTNPPIVGIPISSFYLLILVIAPLPSAADSAVIGVYCVLALIIPELAPGHEAYDFDQTCILFGCLAVAYLYVRRVNAALSDSMQKLSLLSYTDPLTGVLNRRAIEVYLDDAYQEQKARTAAILLFDIDDFKQYNDNYSHAEGDVVLKTVCRAVVSLTREKSGFLFRYGGEEFVVILLDQTDEEIVQVGQSIKKAIHAAKLERHDLKQNGRIAVTVGCAREELTQALRQTYIVRADEQLYIGKNGGKDCVVYNGEICG